MSYRSVIATLCMSISLILVGEANAVICPTTKFKCQLDSDATLETCKYVACGGSCCTAPGSIILDLSGKAFGNNDVGNPIEALISPLPSPPLAESILSGLVLCRNMAGGENWGTVEGEIATVLEGLGAIGQVADNGTIAETLRVVPTEADLDTLDQFCTSGHVAYDFLPFSFTLLLSVVNPDGSVDQNDSIAAACVHPFPDTIGVVAQGPDKGTITGGPYECDSCPFQDAGGGFADTAACATCVNSNGELNGNCPPLGQTVKPN